MKAKLLRASEDGERQMKGEEVNGGLVDWQPP